MSPISEIRMKKTVQIKHMRLVGLSVTRSFVSVHLEMFAFLFSLFFLTSDFTCEIGQFKCSTELNDCISERLVCDGNDDCGDNSDEQNCGKITITHPYNIV